MNYINWSKMARERGFDDVREMLVHHYRHIERKKVVHGMSILEMSEMYGVSRDTLRRKMNRLEISRRDGGDCIDTEWEGDTYES